MKSKLPSKAELQAALEDLSSTNIVDQIPPGWLTTEQWADLTKLETSHVSKRIRKRVKEGLWECRKFKINTPRGVYPTPHYRKIVIGN